MTLDLPAISRDLNAVITSNGFMNTITVPTRVTLECESVLDLFITNLFEINIRSGVLLYCISDHLPIFLCTALMTQCTTKPRTIIFQSITEEALGAFHESLLQIDWTDITKIVDADDAFDNFQTNI